MNARIGRAALAAVASLLAAVAGCRPDGEARAADGEVRTFAWDLSAYASVCAQPCFLDALLLGPVGGTVVQARLVVEFAPFDRYDATGLSFEMLAPIRRPDSSTGALWTVTGSDLGWSRPGVVSGSSSTHELDGAIAGYPGNVFTAWQARVGAPGDPWVGRLSRLRYEIDVVDLEPPLIECPTDINGDGVTDSRDVAAIHRLFGACSASNCPGDVNRDGVVDAKDLLLVRMADGGFCPIAPIEGD